VPRLCELYPGICLTTGGKARKTLSQGSRSVLVVAIRDRVFQLNFNFLEIPRKSVQIRADLFHVDERTDRHKEAYSRLPQPCERD
jgi:hypothetical protein